MYTRLYSWHNGRPHHLLGGADDHSLHRRRLRANYQITASFSKDEANRLETRCGEFVLGNVEITAFEIATEIQVEFQDPAWSVAALEVYMFHNGLAQQGANMLAQQGASQNVEKRLECIVPMAESTDSRCAALIKKYAGERRCSHYGFRKVINFGRK